MRIILQAALVAAIAMPVAAGEPKFDGKQPVVCAALEAIQCEKATGVAHVCARGDARGLEVPQFLRIDFENKMLMATADDGEEKEGAILNLSRGNGHIVIQGVEDGNGWSLVLDEETGHMAASVVGDEEGKMVFGACTPI